MGDIDSGYARLEDQINWYDGKSTWSQRKFKGLKVVELVSIALIPFLTKICPLITASLGVVAIVLEAVQHLCQYQHNWITYRSTCEALKHEKFLYLAKAQEYDLPDDAARKRLAERVEALVSTEHAKWIINTNKVNKKITDAQ